ncbi:MAG: alpha/beta fold hydrolase [Armatimonadetes bacterium]|nr:alpha/beta fold hydrolase [Anaerolineae bacterium]
MPKRVRNLLVFTVVTATFAVSAVLLYVCFVQAQGMVAFRAAPRTAYTTTPADLGMTTYQAMHVTSFDDLRLEGWYVPPAVGSSGASIVFVHGHRGDRTQLAAERQLLAAEGYGLLTIDLRNAGTSEGSATTMGLYETQDVISAFEWLSAQPGVDGQRIALYGVSMGGTTAIRVMARLPEARALVVDSAYSSLLELTSDKVTQVTGLPGAPFANVIVWMASRLSNADLFAVRPIDDIASIAPRPILLMHGAIDEVIPVSHMQALYAAANEPKTLVIIPGALHMQTYQTDPAGLPSTGIAVFARRAAIVGFRVNIICFL